MVARRAPPWAPTGSSRWSRRTGAWSPAGPATRGRYSVVHPRSLRHLPGQAISARHDPVTIHPPISRLPGGAWRRHGPGAGGLVRAAGVTAFTDHAGPGVGPAAEREALAGL